MVHFKVNTVFILFSIFLLITIESCKGANRTFHVEFKKQNESSNVVVQDSYCFNKIIDSLTLIGEINLIDTSHYYSIDFEEVISWNNEFSIFSSQFMEYSFEEEAFIVKVGQDSILLLVGRAVGATAPYWNYECYYKGSKSDLKRLYFTSLVKSKYSLIYDNGELVFVEILDQRVGPTDKNEVYLEKIPLLVIVFHFDQANLQFEYNCFQ